ncbi:coenzyme F420-0:L-glutamate ligase [Methanobrevibacter sp. TMH8]|uniref:coenzyme F420-0:L-glutamate ligase n=1 Tax=Methanobrevibacter sp. TMH8 TaxID=2848611 RepID=UPI001CC9A117|nr:coenzyme F420-0:L-glutamate ligase [Methanobrevibacter sp. TMH8]MBZ9570761.1 coenzyme F420-0:L-glutamate ligase [Methanobrevibacter sp. TMH8]
MKKNNLGEKALNYKIAKTSKGIEYKYVKNKEYIIIPIETGYIKANDSLESIINPAIELMEESDYLVIAETPIAISQGRLIDEANFEPGISAKFLAIIWSKYIWGYILGPLFGIKKRTIKNLRKLPPESKRHKEVILKLYGWKHALKPASEAGVDLSNAPGTYVSLLPENPQKVVNEIAKEIEVRNGFFGKVLIIDTDATYKRGKKYFTGLPIAIEGIDSNKGFYAYLLGQISENVGSTPLGSSCKLSIEKSIKIANIAEDYQKSLSTNMETIHSVKNVLNTDINDVSVETLDSIVHTPAVIIRKIKDEKIY